MSSVQPRPRPSMSSPQAGHEDIGRDRLVLGRAGGRGEESGAAWEDRGLGAGSVSLKSVGGQ